MPKRIFWTGSSQLSIHIKLLLDTLSNLDMSNAILATRNIQWMNIEETIPNAAVEANHLPSR